ncbi:MAG: hypothetical protein AAFR28_17745 [Pseudomonadota bacterium]
MFSRKLFVAAVLAVIGAGAIVETAAREPDLIYERYGERRAVFQDWLAACRPGGYCSVLAYNGVGPEAVGVDANYIIRVSSGAPGLGYDVVFTGVAAMVSEESDILVTVDDEEIAYLIPGENLGWARQPDGGVNDYLFSQSVANVAIVPAMRDGGRMSLAFRDLDGAPRLVGFSLIGLSAALNWIETNRYRL